MKKIALFLTICIAVSCSSNPSKEVNKTTASTTDTSQPSPVYPYTITAPDTWAIGSNANIMIALSSLKKWADGKIDESAAYFGDTARLQLDGYDKTLSRDSVRSMLADIASNYKSVDIKMDDWVSVISKDKKQEWVTIWYNEYWETKNGVKDSAAFINDFQISKGKIIRLDEYSRKLH